MRTAPHRLDDAVGTDFVVTNYQPRQLQFARINGQHVLIAPVVESAPGMPRRPKDAAIGGQRVEHEFPIGGVVHLPRPGHQ